MSDAWRILDTGSSGASFNMAIDEAIALMVRQGLSPPTLRIYGWNLPSVSIGYFQKSGDLDVEYCRKKHIPIVRRPTGGRAVFHLDEITYSFSMQTKTGIFSRGLLDSYRNISAAFALALSKVGLSPQTTLRRHNSKSGIRNPMPHNPLCFESISYGEISVNNMKIIGSAQKRWSDGLLQQGSIPFTADENELLNIFPQANLHIGKKVFGVKHLLPALSHDDFKRAMREAFEETFLIEFIRSDLSRDELALARKLEAEKYLNDAWTYNR